MFRQDVSAPELYAMVWQELAEIEDTRQKRTTSISYVDALSSALAMFAFKSPSLLAFDHDVRRNEVVQGNLQRIFQLERVPSDTAMREIIDDIPTERLFAPFRRVFSALQRGKDLEPFVFMDGYYLLALDGTGFFSPSSVHCDACGVKRHRNGSVTYYHQALSGVLIHPQQKAVIPLAPEAITKQDDAHKNDCERNAGRRFLERLRREHPHLILIVTEDGLSANAPHIELLKPCRPSRSSNRSVGPKAALTIPPRRVAWSGVRQKLDAFLRYHPTSRNRQYLFWLYTESIIQAQISIS